MGYNITSVKTLKLAAFMRPADILRVLDRYARDLPEGTFLESMRKQALNPICADHPEQTVIALPNLWWQGEGSGRAYEILTREIAPLILGEVHAIFTWEGGDSFSGMIIKDGVVTDCDVVQTLVPRGKP